MELIQIPVLYRLLQVWVFVVNTGVMENNENTLTSNSNKHINIIDQHKQQTISKHFRWLMIYMLHG